MALEAQGAIQGEDLEDIEMRAVAGRRIGRQIGRPQVAVLAQSLVQSVDA
jgi:hypothetical protein